MVAMPPYFAYGSNLDRTGMAWRCPRSVPLRPARLPDHRFFIMGNGYASVRAEAGAVTHGLLWAVPEADWPALDAYEEVDGGLYRKAAVAVDLPDGSLEMAIAYIGGSTVPGRPKRSYMEGVVAAAMAAGLPAGYCDELRRWLPRT